MVERRREVADRGHRALPHTADVILEAWGPDLAACCEEAVAALVDCYVEPARRETVRRPPVHLAPAPADTLLLGLLDEVIFVLDTAEAVPVGAEVTATDDGGLDVVVLVAARAEVTGTGAVPKAVARSELRVDAGPQGARSRFLVDV